MEVDIDVSANGDMPRRNVVVRGGDGEFTPQAGDTTPNGDMNAVEPEMRFRKQIVNQSQIDFSFTIHRKNAFASAARNRVLSEFRNGELYMERNGVQVFPSESWMMLWERNYKTFLADWYDWYKCVGIVPLRIVEIAPQVFVPRVPQGKFRIYTYVNPINDVQCFEYWRYLEQNEIDMLANPSKKLDRQQGAYGRWLYDPSVVFHAHMGVDPDPMTGDLHSSVSTLVSEVLFAQSLQLLHLQQLTENSSRRPWLENTAPYKPSKTNVDGVQYNYYGKSNDPDQVSTGTGLEDNVGGSHMTTTERQAHDQLHLFDIYESKWTQYADTVPPSGSKNTLAVASAILDDMASRDEQAPRPLPPQMKIVQRQAYPVNTGFVEQMKLSQEQIAVVYGLSRDSLSSGEALRGNTTAITKSFDEHMSSLWTLVSGILTHIFHYIHMDFEVDDAMRSFMSQPEYERLDDIFSLAKHYKSSQVTLRLTRPSRVEDSESLTKLYGLGVIEWESYVALQRRQFNFIASQEVPKEIWSTDERKHMLALGAAKVPDTTKPS